MTIGPSSMGSSGCCAPGLLEGIYRSGMVPGRRWPAVSGAGGRRGSGTGYWPSFDGRRMRKGNWTGRSTMWTAPQCELTSTQPVQKGDPRGEGLCRSRGGFSTKVRVRAEGKGKLMALVLTPEERHEGLFFPQLMEGGAVKRKGPGRPRLCPGRVVGDKGYSICAGIRSGSLSLARVTNPAPVPSIARSTDNAIGWSG